MDDVRQLTERLSGLVERITKTADRDFAKYNDEEKKVWETTRTGMMNELDKMRATLKNAPHEETAIEESLNKIHEYITDLTVRFAKYDGLSHLLFFTLGTMSTLMATYFVMLHRHKKKQ